PDPEGRLDEPHLRTKNPREEDVPDPVVDGVRPVDPALLDEDATEAGAGGGRRYLTRVVRLDAADGDERVGALRDRVGDEVLELARLVAAEGQAGAHVVALRPQGSAAQVIGQTLERMDGRRPEQERVALEPVERRRHARSVARRRPNATRTAPVTASSVRRIRE